MDTFLQTAGADTGFFYSERGTTAKKQEWLLFPRKRQPNFFLNPGQIVFFFLIPNCMFNIHMKPEHIQYLCIIPGLIASLLRIATSKRCA